jgi:multidrug transporter EmrE-like cation transporter
MWYIVCFVKEDILHTFAVMLVLASGISHAVWNMLTKQSQNKMLYLWMIFVPSTLLLLPRLIEEALRPGTSWQGYLLLALSMSIQGGYAFFLSQSLTYGDISQVYPMMRGIGVLLIPLVSTVFLNESLTLWGWSGLALIALGFCTTSGLAFFRNKRAIPGKVILYTVGVGICTMSYVLVDKINLFHFSPIALLEASNIGFMLGLTPFIRFRSVEWRKEIRRSGRLLLIGSILSPGSYLLFLFAMNLSPLTYVAPLREIGTVIGTVAGIYLLKEPREITRIISAGIIFTGIVLIGIWGI